MMVILLKGCDFVPIKILKSRCRKLVTEKADRIITNILDNKAPKYICAIFCRTA